MTLTMSSLIYQSSGMTALLLTNTPAIVVLMAHFFLPDERLNRLTRKELGRNSLKECFKCKNGGNRCSYMIQKVNKRSKTDKRCDKAIEYWESYDAIACSLEHNGVLDAELRPFVMCGACSKKIYKNPLDLTVLPESYIELSLDTRLSQIKVASGWLNTQIEDLRQKVAEAEARLQAYQTRYISWLK